MIAETYGVGCSVCPRMSCRLALREERNLVLLNYGPDDLYGKWVVCEIGIMALANTQKLIGRFGISEKTVIPFGFRNSEFYDQIQHATGIMDVFTYNCIEDAVDFFAQLLNEALK